jgi:hypothetical protein
VPFDEVIDLADVSASLACARGVGRGQNGINGRAIGEIKCLI